MPLRHASWPAYGWLDAQWDQSITGHPFRRRRLGRRRRPGRLPLPAMGCRKALGGRSSMTTSSTATSSSCLMQISRLRRQRIGWTGRGRSRAWLQRHTFRNWPLILPASAQECSGNRPLLSATPPLTPDTEYEFTIPFTLSYEVDLFGRVRRNLEAANASLQSTAADLVNVQLVLTSELAADYFNLRELDAEIAVVQELVSIEQKGLELVQHRHEGGVANGLEVAQQAALLEATVAQASLLQQQRAQYEHAIAVLTGNPASSFSVPVAPLRAVPPPVPLGVPSDVLERRPDISTYERLMAYQNAQVGIAATAFYPHITLSGSGGWQSRDIATLVDAPSAFWSLGSDLLQPIFNGGRNRANLEAAKAGYNEAVANYREAVLTAFQQVEDGLSGLQTLSKALATQRTAVEDSRRALTLANNRYTGGLTTYLDVITAQTTLLNNERLATQLLGQQMVTSVYLVKALGGGWDSSEIKNQQIYPKAIQAVQQ